jgi:hypothetical protein
VRTQFENVETLHHPDILCSDRLLPLAQKTVRANEIAYANNRGTVPELFTARCALRDWVRVERPPTKFSPNWKRPLPRFRSRRGLNSSGWRLP